MKKAMITTIIAMVACMLVLTTQFTLLVIQPIGMLPDGITLVMWRTGKLHFIESPDGICAREMQGVSLLCRMAVVGGIVKEENILFRWPYSDILYLWSTGCVRYEK